MIHAYRKPLDPSTLVIEMNLVDAELLHGLASIHIRGEDTERLIGALGAFIVGNKLDAYAPPSNDDGPFQAYETRGGRFCVSCKSTDWTEAKASIGPVFVKESTAREAAATMNALVALERRQ